MHEDVYSWGVGCEAGGSGCVEGAARLVGVPGVLGEAVVVFWVNDGELSAGEGDAAEGVAEAQKAVEQDGGDEDAFEEGWDFDFDVQLDDAPSGYKVKVNPPSCQQTSADKNAKIKMTYQNSKLRPFDSSDGDSLRVRASSKKQLSV